MKLRLLIRIAVIVSVVLLCAGIGIYSYLRLNAAEEQKDFNLYSLVPQDAIAILETDKMADLVDEINELKCSQDNHFLYISDLFVFLKQYLHTLTDGTPHGLSRQMNKMLISFHEPDNPMNQVLYCSLGAGDYNLLENFIRRYSSNDFPAKLFEYKGERICLYPIKEGRFLAAYVTSDFLVLSFQERLIEQVIEARKGKKSLHDIPAFRNMTRTKRSNVSATVYLRMKKVDMGKNENEQERIQTTVGNWAEFDLKWKDEAIYCSGISYGNDSVRNFINAMRKQEPIEGFPGNRLPSTTFFYNCWSFSSPEPVYEFTRLREHQEADSGYVKERDAEWMDFLEEHASGSIMSCLFLPKDTATHPCAILSVSMKNGKEAERHLQALLHNTPPESGKRVMQQEAPQYGLYPHARSFRQYRLPRTTLLSQMTGITDSAICTQAAFYRDAFLLAPDATSLSAYIDALEQDSILEGTPVYEEGIGSLSPSYNFMMMTDMDELLRQPAAYVRLVPNFFFRHHNFFRHFILAIQFTCSDNVVYPNIVLLYKGE